MNFFKPIKSLLQISLVISLLEITDSTLSKSDKKSKDKKKKDTKQGKVNT